MHRLTKLALLLALPLGGVGGGLLCTSCSDLFDAESDRQIYDPDLSEKTDSMFYTLGILKGLQQVADQYVLQGEMRGDLVAVNSHTETDLRQLANFTATTACKYDSAYLYYRIINNCNYYIAHRDTTLHTGSRQVARPEYAEALAVRAWTYMQLAKTYGEVPFYTDPLTSIEQANQNFPTKDLQGIVDALAPEMEKFSGTVVPTYGNISAGLLNSSTSSNQEEKTIVSSRTMLPIDLVLGDLYLETHQYERAARSYFRYLSDNKWQIRQAYINPMILAQRLGDKLPSSFVFNTSSGAYQWANIFSIGSTNDIITYIPLAANRLRGITTDLPRIFGYDFYSTTAGSMSSNARYLVERQIEPSAAYTTLNNSQTYYYTPNASQSAGTVVMESEMGDLRFYETFAQATKNDSTFSVMEKFNSANVMLYRTATIYLRLAEAINRMGYPDAAFAILKDGISPDMLTTRPSYLSDAAMQMLQSTVPFLSSENREKFTNNWGIHSRGTYYTRGEFSPYQMDTIVAKKIQQLKDDSPLAFVPTGTKADTINAMEDLICDEMALELAYEGSRFGDLTRMARHKNLAGYNGGNFGTRWLNRKLSFKTGDNRLLDERNWLLPLK
jgi:hypothetical protein